MSTDQTWQVILLAAAGLCFAIGALVAPTTRQPQPARSVLWAKFIAAGLLLWLIEYVLTVAGTLHGSP